MVIERGNMTRRTRKPAVSGERSIVPKEYTTPKKKWVQARMMHFFIAEPKEGLKDGMRHPILAKISPFALFFSFWLTWLHYNPYKQSRAWRRRCWYARHSRVLPVPTVTKLNHAKEEGWEQGRRTAYSYLHGLPVWLYDSQKPQLKAISTVKKKIAPDRKCYAEKKAMLPLGEEYETHICCLPGQEGYRANI